MYQRPFADEYPSYYANYIQRVSQGSLVDVLTRQLEDTTDLLTDLSEDRANYRYAPGKWTVKEVLGHVADTERVMSYRLLRFSRGDKTELAGYDDNQYVREAGFQSRLLSDLIEDFRCVRRSTLSLLSGIPAANWERKGVANGGEMSVRALGFIIAGHELHHVHILKDKYLG